MAEVQLKIGAYIEGLKKGLNESRNLIRRFTTFVKSHNAQLRKVRMQAGIALAGEILAVRRLVKAYAEEEAANKKLQAVIKSTGAAAGYTFEELDKMAAGLQSVTTSADELIKTAQAQLLTFTKIGRDIFPEVLEVAMDMSKLLGTDLKMSIIQVGKAFQDPILGATALRRVGVNLDEQMKAQIQTYLEMGQLQKAQALILKELQTEFGGQARAAAEGAGALEQLANIWNELEESLGEAILPILKDIAKHLKDIIPKITDFVKENRTLIATLAGGGIAGTGLVLLLSQFALAFSNPVTGVIAVVAAAAIAIAALTIHMRKFRGELVDMPFGLKGFDEAIEETKKQIKEQEKALKEAQGEWYNYLEIPGVGPLPGLGKHIDGIANKLQGLQTRLKNLLEEREKLASLLPGGPGSEHITTGEGEEEGEGFGFSTDEMFGPPAPEDTEEKFDEQIDLIQEFLDERIAMFEDAQERERRIAEQAGWGLYNIWDAAFSRMLDAQQSFGTSLALSMLEGLIGMLQMIVDMKVQEIIAEQIAAMGKITLSSLFNPANLIKLAFVSAIGGAAKAALGAVVGKARGSMAKNVPRYQYGGVVPETGLAVVHAGERYFNPDHPGESLRNMGGGLTINMNVEGDVKDGRDAEEALYRVADYLFSRRLAKGLT